MDLSDVRRESKTPRFVSRIFAKPRRVLALLFLLLIGLVGTLKYVESQRYQSPIEWEPYSDERLKQAQADDKLVLVSVMATWDISTVWFERQVIDTPRVRRVIESRNVVCLQVDLAELDDAGFKKWSHIFGHKSPIGAVIFPRKSTGKTSPLVVDLSFSSSPVTNAILRQNGEAWPSFIWNWR